MFTHFNKQPLDEATDSDDSSSTASTVSLPSSPGSSSTWATSTLVHVIHSKNGFKSTRTLTLIPIPSNLISNCYSNNFEKGNEVIEGYNTIKK